MDFVQPAWWMSEEFVLLSLQTALDVFRKVLQSGIHAVAHPLWRLGHSYHSIACGAGLAASLGFCWFISPTFVCENPILNTLPCFRNWLGEGLVIQATNKLRWMSLSVYCFYLGEDSLPWTLGLDSRTKCKVLFKESKSIILVGIMDIYYIIHFSRFP